MMAAVGLGAATTTMTISHSGSAFAMSWAALGSRLWTKMRLLGTIHVTRRSP